MQGNILTSNCIAAALLRQRKDMTKGCYLPYPPPVDVARMCDQYRLSPSWNNSFNHNSIISGHAVLSKLGHDFSKSQKDARNISHVKAQTGTTAILHCNIDVSSDIPVSRNLQPNCTAVIFPTIYCFQIYWVKQAPNSPIITVDSKVLITDRRFRISDTVKQ